MKRTSLNLMPLLFVVVLVVVLSADMRARREAEGTNGDQSTMVTPSIVCSAEASQMSQQEATFEPLANCDQSMRCHTVADCPDYHPVGCQWFRASHCCLLECP